MLHLLRFGVENFKSFRDYQEVSFVSTSQNDEPSFRFGGRGIVDHGVLPMLGVYGPNASGKSNLLQSLLQFQELVKLSFFIRPGAEVLWQPWRLEKSEGAAPTRFEIDFLLDGVRFYYGFTFNSRAFLTEWLHRWPNGRKQVLYERETLAKEPWYFGPSFKGPKRSLANSTRENCLFLSASAHQNHQALGDVYLALVNGIREDSQIGHRGFPLFSSGASILDESNRGLIAELLGAFDLGCSGITVEAVDKDETDVIEKLRSILKPEALEAVSTSLGDGERYKIRLDRKSGIGDSWSLPPEEESRGTNILLRRINDLLELQSGILVVDEIETSLHPEICAMLIGFFSRSDLNRRQVQLLFTTHNRSLMEHLRRDEVVLVEKDSEGASNLWTAADFKDLRSRDNLRRVYSEGRLGATPVLGDLSSLATAHGA